MPLDTAVGCGSEKLARSPLAALPTGSARKVARNSATAREPTIVTLPESATPHHAARATLAELAVLVAVLVAAALRFFALTQVPPALNQDEAVNGYDAYSLLLTGRDHLGHPFPIAGLESFGDWVSPLLTVLSV